MQPADTLLMLPCACQNLRRLTQLVTRIHESGAEKAGLEIPQFGLLTALAATREANQKRLSHGQYDADPDARVVTVPTTAVSNEFLAAARGMGWEKLDFAVDFSQNLSGLGGGRHLGAPDSVPARSLASNVPADGQHPPV